MICLNHSFIPYLDSLLGFTPAPTCSIWPSPSRASQASTTSPTIPGAPLHQGPQAFVVAPYPGTTTENHGIEFGDYSSKRGISSKSLPRTLRATLVAQGATTGPKSKLIRFLLWLVARGSFGHGQKVPPILQAAPSDFSRSKCHMKAVT